MQLGTDSKEVCQCHIPESTSHMTKYTEERFSALVHYLFKRLSS